MSLLAYALGALLRQRRRTVALVGCLAAATAFLSAVLFLTDALRAEAARAQAYAPDLVVQRLSGGRPALLDAADAPWLGTLPAVARMRARRWGYLFLPSIQSNVTVIAVGHDDELPSYGAVLSAGRALRSDERGGCIVGAELATALGVQPGDQVNFPGSGTEHGPRLVVTGVFRSSVSLFTSDVLFVADDDARTLLNLPDDRVTDVALWLTNPDESAVLARRIVAQRPGTRVLERRLLARVHALSYGRRAGFVLGATLPTLLVLFVLAWDRVAGLGTAERHEIAVLKASGWSTAHVITMKLYEALLVSLLASSLGLVLGYLWAFPWGAPGLREVLAGWSVLYPTVPLTPAVDGGQLFGLLALITAPYLALSVGPAWKAATLDPLEAMRQG